MQTTSDDFALVKEYMLLPLILEKLERDYSIIENQVPTPDVYKKIFDTAIDLVTIEHIMVKKQLRKRGIKIYEEQRDKIGLSANFVCRAYHETMSLMWNNARYDVIIRIKRYLGEGIGSYIRKDLPEHMIRESYLDYPPPHDWI